MRTRRRASGSGCRICSTRRSCGRRSSSRAGEKNVWLERVYGIEPFDAEEVVARTLEHAERLAPYVADTSLLVDRALRDGRRVLFEGAQGTLLDLDHGTYPFVTSSSPIAAGAAVSFGIGPQRIDEVVGVSKAYVTRVGEGPVPERDRRALRRSACASSAASSAP